MKKGQAVIAALVLLVPVLCNAYDTHNCFVQALACDSTNKATVGPSDCKIPSAHRFIYSPSLERPDKSFRFR